MQKKWVRQAKAGNAQSFYRLIEPLSQKLYHYALSLSATREDAEDALQEAYLKAFKNIQNLRDEAAFPAYLYRIVRNTIYDMQRKNKAINEEPIATQASGDPWQKIEQTEQRKKIHQALAQLPLEFREPLLLQIWEGFSYKEIAEILNLETGTVKSRLNRAKRQLLAFYTKTGTKSS